MALLSSRFMAKLDGLQVAMRKVLAGRFRGEKRSRRKGRSVEFADHREYAFGDDIRFIDWHLAARLDRFFLKLFHDEEELRLFVLVDASKSMAFGEPQKIDHARRVAAALAYVGLSSMNRVKLVALAEDAPVELAWQRGVQSIGRVFQFLEDVEPGGKNALRAGIGRWVSESRPSGVVVLISDLMDREGPIPIVKPLVRNVLDAHLLQILTTEEVDPELAGDFRLIDSEEKDGVDVSGTPQLIAAYRRNLTSYLAQIEEYARRRGLGYLLTRTDVSFEDLVLRHLRERGLLR
jgi:uncharacterized protein (DUF58 family)